MNLASKAEMGCCPPRHFEGIVGQSSQIRSIFRLVEKIVDSDSTVMITGESGTGKGMVARAIHRHSRRKNQPFVAINCGAIPKTLLESELFGHARGAFTGATTSKIGKFEKANGGTVFLDEIGDMSPDLQVKILKVIEEREFDPVGSTRSVKADIRVITATHKDLAAEVKMGNFREDLYYRLYVIPIHMPPLRNRPSDISLLIDHFLNHFNKKNKRQVTGVAACARRVLLAHHWPGNVRELKNMMERMVVLKGEGEITINDLPSELNQSPCGAISPEVDFSEDGICLNTAVTEFEKALILKSLEKTHWVKKRAAQLLQLNRTTLVEKIKRYNLEKS